MTTWTYGRMSDMQLAPGPYWFAGVVIVHTITGPSQHVINDRRAEVLYITANGATWGKYRVIHARGLWTPDTGTHPGTPPESAWPDHEGKVRA